MSNYITFTINNQVMGVQVSSVEKIMNFTVITKIPSDLDYLEGVISYHDEIIPAVNLGKLLKIADTALKDSQQIIILNYNGKKAGVLVDEVREIEEVHQGVPYLKANSQLITGTIRLKDSMINIINPEIVNFAKQR